MGFCWGNFVIFWPTIDDELYSQIIWLGDLNYRIDATDEDTWALVDQGAWECLLQKDQVLKISQTLLHSKCYFSAPNFSLTAVAAVFSKSLLSHDFQLRFEDVLLWAAEAWTKSRACVWRLEWKPHLLSTNLQIYHQFRWVLWQRYTTWCQATHTCLVNWNHSLTTKFMTIVGLGAWYTPPILLLFYVPFSIEC